MLIALVRIDRALASAGLWLRTDEPPPTALPLFRRMRHWQDPDNPGRDVGLIVIDGNVQSEHWNLLRMVFEQRGEWLPDIDS